jgi:hypothetical protein
VEEQEVDRRVGGGAPEKLAKVVAVAGAGRKELVDHEVLVVHEGGVLWRMRCL